MSNETIRLVGGPADGEVRAWRGGDVFRLRYLPDVGPPIRAEDQFTVFEVEYHEYRRSINDHSVFVHQP
jgi:hypothetical protein